MTPPPEPPEAVTTFSLLSARPGDPPNIKALRFAVIGMGAILILGVGAIILRIVHLATRPAPGESTASSAAPATRTQLPPLNVQLPVPPGAKVLSQSVSGNRLSVHFAADGDETIAVIDLDTGQTAATLRLPPARK